MQGAFAERCALRFFCDAASNEPDRLSRHVRRGRGFCGLDNVADDIRTFRCDRIVRAWRLKAYAILRFNLNDYLFFGEFDFADRPPRCSYVLVLFSGRR